jgi:DNA-binding NarL/FixJ family response regulator
MSQGSFSDAAAASVGVVDSVPLYRRGLGTVCERAGLRAVERTNLNELPAETLSAVLVVLRSGADWQALGDGHAELDGCPIVAVLPSLAPLLVERALQAGATGVVEASAEPANVIGVLRAAIERKTVLPSTLARQLVAESRVAQLTSSQELRRLRALREGATVVELGEQEGYSSRQMQRLLTRLYSRLGATGREDALRLAERLGLLG